MAILWRSCDLKAILWLSICEQALSRRKYWCRCGRSADADERMVRLCNQKDVRMFRIPLSAVATGRLFRIGDPFGSPTHGTRHRMRTVYLVAQPKDRPFGSAHQEIFKRSATPPNPLAAIWEKLKNVENRIRQIIDMVIWSRTH